MPEVPTQPGTETKVTPDITELIMDTETVSQLLRRVPRKKLRLSLPLDEIKDIVNIRAT